jgi:hypothetical protein
MIKPVNGSIEQMRYGLGNGRVLSLAQIRAEIEDQVFRRQRALTLEFGQQFGGHHARTCAQFEDARVRRSQVLQNLGALHGQTTAENRSHFGRRDEIAGGAELARTRAVVAEARRVQRQLHELREIDPATRLLDGGADVLHEGSAVRRLVRREFGQVEGNAHVRWKPLARTGRTGSGIFAHEGAQRREPRSASCPSTDRRAPR